MSKQSKNEESKEHLIIPPFFRQLRSVHSSLQSKKVVVDRGEGRFENHKGSQLVLCGCVCFDISKSVVELTSVREVSFLFRIVSETNAKINSKNHVKTIHTI